MSKSHVTYLFLLLISLGGCNSTPIEPGEVKAKWTKNFHQLGIVPVFPPREDVYVGDIYFYQNDPEDPKYLTQLFKEYGELTEAEQIDLIKQGMGSRLMRLNLSDVLSSEYQETISVPQTSSDYDSILGNPSVAALEDKISQQKVKITGIEKDISDLNKNNADAVERLKQANRVKEDIDSQVTRLLADLNNKKGQNPKPGDTSELDAQLTNAKTEKRLQEDALAEIKHKITLVELDTDEHKRLVKEEKVATYNNSILTTKISRLQVDIAAVPSVPVDYSNEQALYDAAITKQLAAEDEVTAATRNNTDTIANTTPKLTAHGALLAKEKEKLTELNTLKTNIVAAGAKTLYKQPNTESHNLFDWSAVGAREDASRTNRLKLVAFPEFSGTTVSQNDLSALIPAEALKFNISSSSVDRVSLKIPSAESYGISFTTLAEKLFTLNSGKVEFADELSPLIASLELQQLLTQKNEVYLRVITEVYYARAFDVSLFSKDSFGMVVDYAKLPQFTTGDSEEDSGTTDSESNHEDYSYFSGVINSSASSESEEYLSNLRSNLTRSQNVPGGTVQTLNYSDSSIGIRRVFDRPIAIGYRAVTLKVNLCTEDQRQADTCQITIGGLEISFTQVPLAPLVQSN